MDDIIDHAHIDTKHSNEDEMAPIPEWVNKYGDRIGNFGGIDMNVLCLESLPEIRICVLNSSNATFCISCAFEARRYLMELFFKYWYWYG